MDGGCGFGADGIGQETFSPLGFWFWVVLLVFFFFLSFFYCLSPHCGSAANFENNVRDNLRKFLGVAAKINVPAVLLIKANRNAPNYLPRLWVGEGQVLGITSFVGKARWS